jgi:membrane-associated phospholipid phosphatase
MSLDAALFRLVHLGAGRTRLIDSPARACARFGAAGEVVLMLLVGLRHGRRGCAVVARSLAAVGAVYVLSELLGSVVGRARPFARLSEAQELVPHDPARSFPSRHVASAVAMALIARPVAPGLAGAMGALAAGLGLARVRTALHYPTDVVGGIVLGSLVGGVLRAPELSR